ncbi:rootletin [Drosophila eugracilis]|uniref:rootletin n=1 Tax=Drosophila eugracilis TaxID=29029 RepID=UPI001BD949B6|nr:rootletin [Drosophila eugracilis]XP_017084110.2 rootletin [Drosophila eugracilis]
MQAYRDNFKQTPCPSAVDLQAAGPPHPPANTSRLPFSRSQRGRDPSASAASVTASAAGALTPRMMSPGPPGGGGGGIGGGGGDPSALLRQNQELRQRLADESHSYRRRLDTYKQAQHNQANLVTRLQSKIQQYRQRCSDLEDRMHETIKPTAGTGPKLTTGPTTSQVLCSTSLTLGQSSLPCSSSLDSPPPSCSRDYVHDDVLVTGGGGGTAELCRKLEEEHQRCEQVLAQNSALRQQLEESNRTNEALTNDLQKLTNDWAGLRDELLIKEDEFKEEEQAFKDYYNSEHNRLLKMWREVVAVKRSFKEMQTAMKAEVAKMGQEINCVGKDINGSNATVAFAHQQAKRAADEELKQSQRSNDELQNQLATLKVQYESARHEIMERDQRLLELMNQLKKLEDRCAQAESQAALASRYSDEIERLNNSMREIAQAVVQDAEIADREADAEVTGGVMQHMHLTRDAASVAGGGGGPGSTAGGGGGKSPRRNSTRASQAFAEGTISAVQAALHKYQLALHDMQVKFQNTSETLRTTKSQLETSEGTKQLLTTKMQQLTEKLDSSNSKLSELLQERESLQRGLDDVRTQKQQSEMGRADINSAFENLSGDYEKLQLNCGKLQKRIDSMEEDKKAVELEIQRILKDKNITELNLRSEEDRSSRLREETISLREELNRVSLNRDLLEQQRIESDNLINLLEKQKSDLEYDLDKLLLEKCDLQEKHEKLSNNSCSTSDELKSVQNCLQETQEERKKLRIQSADQSNEIGELKKELAVLDKARLELETDNLSAGEKLKCLQLEKEKILQDLACVTRDRGDIHNQLTAMCRKKEALNEELMRTRQRLEQTTETNSRLNRNLEEMVKDVEEKQVVIDLHEKDTHRLNELLAALRSEKESLESVLFDTNTSLEATEERRSQLERDLQEALVREESLKNHVARLQKDLEQCQRKAQETKTQLLNAARAAESDFNQKIANLQACAEDAAKRHGEEILQLRNALEKRMQQALQALQTAKDDEIEKLQERLATLQAHLESLVQQHEEALIRAESEKQQALLIAHRDKQAVAERLEAVSRDLKTEQESLDRSRREANARDEKQRAAIAQLKDEMVHMRTKEEEHKIKLEECIRKQELQLSSMREERDTLCRVSEELKMEIRLKEDKMEGTNNELQDALRKSKEGEGFIDSLRKELTDCRRQLADSNIERDKYSGSNKELRDHVKRVESAKREQARAIEEALQKISNLEDTKNSLENERTRLSTILKETENHFTKTTQDLNATKAQLQKTQVEFAQKDEGGKELQCKLVAEVELKERAQQELCQIKKQLSDLEANLCATRQELGRARCQNNQEEHRFHAREQELAQRLEEGRGREKRLEDQKHNLEVCLADATQQIQELKARLGGAEGRIRALDEQLSCVELHKRDTEQKLSSVVHTLRRIAGIQVDGSVNLSHRLLSPSRRFSPSRSCGDYDNRSTSQCPDGPIDVDPDLIRKGVRNLMHQVAQLEREKDDYKSQLGAAKKQLQDAAEQQLKCDAKLGKLQAMLRNLQEEKSNLETDRKMKISAIQALEEKLKHRNDECQMLRERLAQTEMQLAATSEENGQNEERLEKSRQQYSKLDNEKRQLQEELAKVEGRASKLDLQRVAMEGDLTRLQMALQEKDCSIRQMAERLENQNRALTQLEDRCTALKTTVDQLKERLQKSAVSETQLRGELKTLQKELSEQGHCSQANEDKLKLVQKSLQTAENEKRILTERLDSAQTNLNELRRSQQAQLDGNQRLQEQVTDLEVQRSALESQLRIAKWNQESGGDKGLTNGNGGGNGEEELSRQLKSSQREKSELRSKLQTLQDKVKQLECDRKSKFSGGNAYDRAEKSNSYYGGAAESGEFDSNRYDVGGGNAGTGGGGSFNCGLDHSVIEQETRDLRLKVRRLETLLAEKESELARCKARMNDSAKCHDGMDGDRYRSAQMHAEKLLDAREQSHRQQVLRLENQISMLREQLAQEAKRRQQYILRSSKANREMQHLRSTLGDSLRNVSQHPVDAHLLESESRRLDSAVSMSLPPSTCRDYDRD